MGDYLDWTKYKRRDNSVKAFVWREDGDHPDEDCRQTRYDPVLKENFKGYGTIVKPFVPDTIDAFEDICPDCEIQLQWHGQIQAKNGRMVKVCPGDYIVRETPDDQYPMHEEEFFHVFEVIEEDRCE